MTNLKHLIVLAFAVAVIGCATTPTENFGKLKVGMHKDAVLDSAGSPTNSEFTDGVAVWTYRIYEGDNKVEKEVRMKNDIVTYIGEPQKPKGNPFDRLKVGMQKDHVLDLLGFPKRVEKVGATEVWTYYDGKTLKSLTISNGKISALGVPAKDANAQSDGFTPIEGQ